MTGSKRILFIAEAVTLAHVARPLALAQSLDPARYQTVFACDPRYRSFLQDGPGQILDLRSISSDRFLQALANGSPVYDSEMLREYVRNDLKLIEQVKPDAIVGDFRLSLSASARLAKIPYFTITNAYWSPYYAGGFPLPVLPLTQVLPLPLARMIFQLARPLAFRRHCRPLNNVRQQYGLPSLGSDLRRIYTDADHVLYSDIPELFPLHDLPATHHYLGPILWSPPVAKPTWWDELPTDKPIIYLTLGSSGRTQLLPVILNALSDLPITVMAASAGVSLQMPVPANAYVADYLPGTEAAMRARLVICNGGSLTSQQALAAGVPVLGIASNMDQFLNMNALAAAGVGVLQRADRISPRALRDTVVQLLETAKGATPMKYSTTFAHYSAGKRFDDALQQLSRKLQ